LQENLAVKTIAVAKKFFTIAKHLQDDEKVVNLLTNWLKTGDGSQFSKTHIEMASLYKLESPDHLAVIQAYNIPTWKSWIAVTQPGC
jgi:hypothetical protein